MNQTFSRIAAFSLLLVPVALIARAQTPASSPTEPSTKTPKPTKTPRPTKTPKATSTPRPTPTATRVPVPVSVSEANNNTTIFVAQGGIIELRLAENQTTPYHWQVVQSEGLKQEGEASYQSDANPTGMTGVGGTALYRFRAVKNGTGNLGLDLTYLNAKPEDKPAQTFRAVVKILK